MAFEDYKQKNAVTVVYTGEGKGKTSASISTDGSGFRARLDSCLYSIH